MYFKKRFYTRAIIDRGDMGVPLIFFCTSIINTDLKILIILSN